MGDRRLIGIDLFAGAGGLSLGFEQAGFDVAAAVDIDPVHCAVHEYNFPRCATLCRSVAELDASELRALPTIQGRDIAVVFGGAPCQGFSTIGKRALDDPRNALVCHFVRLVRELQPAYFVFENVRGLTIGAHRRFLDDMIAAFAPDYEVVLPYRVLNAADFGVPQDRRRLFLLGAQAGRRLPRYPEPSVQRVTVDEAIKDLPDADGFEELLSSDCAAAEYGVPSPYAKRLRVLAEDPDDFGYRRRFDRSHLTSSMRTVHTATSKRRFLATESGRTEPISRFRKLDPHGLCNTLRAGSASDHGAFTSPRPIHPNRPRVITNREAARLHSYPDWFRFHVTKWHGFRQIGNSVPPLLARAVSGKIAEVLQSSTRRPAKEISLGDPDLLELSMTEAARKYGVPADIIPPRRRKAA